MPFASVQATYVQLDDLDAGVARLRDGAPHAVIQVEGLTLDLLGEGEREATLLAFGEALNGLREPVQITIHVRPVDMAPRRERFLRHAPPELEDLAVAYADHLDRAAKDRVLLERRYYVTVPAPPPPLPPRARGKKKPFPFRVGTPAAREDQDAAVRRHLTARCDALMAALTRCHLQPRRLGDKEIAALYHSCWCPDMAQRQAIRGTLDDWTALVIGTDVAGETASASVPSSDDVAVHPEPLSGFGYADARLTAGTQPLKDLVAPSSIELGQTWLRIDEEYVRVLLLESFPRRVGLAWLAGILDAGEPVDLAIHLHPLEAGTVAAQLEKQRGFLLSSANWAEERGQVGGTQERATAIRDVEQMRDALQLGVSHAFAAGVYMAIRGKDLDELDARTRRLQATVNRMLARVRIPTWQQIDGFQSVLPQATDHLKAYPMPLLTEHAARMFPFSTSTLAMEDGILLGVARDTHSPVLLDLFDASLQNANVVAVGAPGGGKSYTLKLLLERALLHGVHACVIDREGEYRPLQEAVPGSQRVVLSAGSPHRLNPFDLARRDRSSDPLSDQIAALVTLVGVMVSDVGKALSPQEAATLDTALWETYHRQGIMSDRATHARPVPILADLAAVLGDPKGRAADAGTHHATGASLAARLRPFVSGSASGIFNAPTNVDLEARLVVFDISGLEARIRPLATHLIGTWLWQRARSDPRPRLVVVDEMWDMLKYPSGADFLESVARRARKYWLGLVIATQDVQDVLATAGGRAVANCAETVLLFKQSPAAIPLVVDTYALSPRERYLLLSCGPGTALALCRGHHLSLTIEASTAEHRFATSRPAERQALDTEHAVEQATTSDPSPRVLTALNGHAEITALRAGAHALEAPR